ncbi:hypothetical protein TSPI_00985 [Trichinella spiralis]|uniref:Piwi domain-containing protein n=1 Tax=Trichinella spiralis TaxID=6334 RepID=A0ABR3KL73_TRISP
MKIGGINTKLLEDEVLDNYLYKNNALVIGVDVVHPSAVETHLPSIASVVGNVDANVTKFHASVKIQPAKQELITGFIEQFSDRLLEYVDVNGTALKNIIVYRDGVSEGQFMQVLEEELPALLIMEFKELVDRRDIICARSVSIPAPVYFADLVCARARYHVLAALNSGLVEKFSDEDSKGSSSSYIAQIHCHTNRRMRILKKREFTYSEIYAALGTIIRAGADKDNMSAVEELYIYVMTADRFAAAPCRTIVSDFLYAMLRLTTRQREKLAK